MSTSRALAQRATRLISGGPQLASVLVALIVSSGVFYWASATRWRQAAHVKPAMLQCGAETWAEIQALRRLHPKAEPNSIVAFLHDPFQDWQMEFIAELWFQDRSVTVWVESKNRHTPAELTQAAHIYDYHAGQFFTVR